MSNVKISIVIDEDLLRRVDRVADVREESRSAIIEKLVQIGIDDQERLIGDKEASLMQMLVVRAMESPRVVQALAKLVGEQLTPAEVEGMRERAAKVRRARERVRKERDQRG